MLAPIAWRVPPRHYGPWEQFVSLLTEGLVTRGVDVTLFATGDSKSGAKLISVQPTGYSESTGVDVKVWEGLHISEVFERSGQFDLIHNSFDFLPLTYSALVATPMVTTIHGFSSERILPVYQKYNGRTNYIAISETDRHPTLDYLATIHHGIDMGAFGISENPESYLLFLGRIHPEKGVEEAITVARRAGRPLIIAGIVQDRAYFERCVAPYLDDTTVRYLGPIGPQRRRALLSEAAALLHLISFEEPFGFSVVEAMASGTPVIAFARGSMPELISHGRNGFLTHDVDSALGAVSLIGDLDRSEIRREAVRRFDRWRMVDQYLAAYDHILEGPNSTNHVRPYRVVGGLRDSGPGPKTGRDKMAASSSSRGGAATWAGPVSGRVPRAADSVRVDGMRINVGCEFSYRAEVATHGVFQVEPRLDAGVRAVDEQWTITPQIGMSRYLDGFGNMCRRSTLSAGLSSWRYSAVLDMPSEADPEDLNAAEVAAEFLPNEVLVHTLPSRFCPSQELADEAWRLFGSVPPGWGRVQTICDWVHSEITFNYLRTTPLATAVDVLGSRAGVCRDFAHLAVSFCRALNIPARYAFGYLPDIGVPLAPGPMDFCAWMEVFLGGRWWTFDPRNNQRRIGRALIARGRDALDVAMVSTYGGPELTSMTVWADEVTT